MLKKWTMLPEYMQNKKVKRYYQMLQGRQSSMRCKRMLDVFMSLFALIFLSPVIVVVSLLIKKDSSGPVFYRQVRVTQYGKEYQIFKFRTMVVGADKAGPLVTAPNDSRVTKIGRKLRKYRIDEVPQLLNILKGEMSFVGTRPEVKAYVEQYGDEMYATLLLPAGVTSRTSILYRDEEKTIDKYIKTGETNVNHIYVTHILPEKMKSNLEYIENFSILSDLKIMIQTLVAMIR